MPCRHKVLTKPGVLLCVYTGTIGISDILAHLDRVDADPEYRNGIVEFADMSRLDKIRISASEMLQIAALVRGMYARRKPPATCIFWAKGGAAYATARAYQLAMAPLGAPMIHVEREMEDALAPLDAIAASAVRAEIDKANFRLA